MISTKRRTLTTVGGLALAVTLVGCSGGNAPAEIDLGEGPAVVGTVKEGALEGVTLTLSSWGGILQEGQVEAASVPFAEVSGATMLDDGPTEYAKVKAQVDSNQVTWDIVDSDIIWAGMQCGDDGLYLPLDTDIVDTSKIPEGLAGDCYVPAMQYGYVIFYNEDAYPTAPTGWADFFDTEKFPGKRAVAGFEDVGPGVYEGALLADGVAPEDLYPLDMDRVYDKLDTVRDDLIYWKTGAESQSMMENGEADMVLAWSGRGYGAVENGANYKPIWNQGLIVADALGVPKNAKNPDAAFAYINYYLGAEQQAKLSEITSYSPVNIDSKPELTELGESFLITKPEIYEQLVPTDAAWWGSVYDVELERWLNWIQG